MKDHVTSMEWKPRLIEYFQFNSFKFKRVLTKQNVVYWYKWSVIFWWVIINDPRVFGKLEEQRRNLLNG